MPRRHLFTSESVSMGHPDKVADQVSDAILDAFLALDPLARVACEVLITKGLVVVAGEVSSPAVEDVDIDTIVRSTISVIGYDDPSLGFDADGAEVRIALQSQSADIALGVDADTMAGLGAGDQGLMFGHAVQQTDELMPLPIMLAHRLVAVQAAVRRSSVIPHLRPDAKSQVSVFYEGSRPVAVDSVVLSTQHGPEWNDSQKELEEEVVSNILVPALGEWWRDDLVVHVNPTGKFEIGGPAADTGLTGRKIIVDTYGGWGRHGGGAFSGKDASKVDRSASYMARHVAKTIVAAGLATECEFRLGYAIGVPDPTAVTVDCHDTAVVDEAQIERAVREVFDLTPGGIIEHLGLLAPIYAATAHDGHFGREPDSEGSGTFGWERLDRVDELRSAAGAESAA